MKITPELARIHAHICGDGAVYTLKCKRLPSDLLRHKRKNLFYKDHIIEYWNNCKELLEEVRTDFKIAFNRNSKIRKNGKSIRFKGCKHIIVLLDLENKNSYNWKIPAFILNSNKRVVSNWLRAFFDDESTVELAKNRIRIKSMNKNGLFQVANLLSKLKIYSNITGENIDKSWYLNLYKDNVKKYAEKINFLHPQKKAKLKIMGGGRISV